VFRPRDRPIHPFLLSDNVSTLQDGSYAKKHNNHIFCSLLFRRIAACLVGQFKVAGIRYFLRSR
uniref:hypothetical protein n=1 Tax=Vibrio sp. 11986-1-5 TaxID=2211215 RepID=UPI0030D8D26A